VGDGSAIRVNDSLDGVAKATDTFVGAALGETKLRRFLVGLNGSEITGLTELPEGKAIFL
jgi:secreted PhoX family phosphatase